MKLNEANLAVWYELMKDETMRDNSHKLLLNYALITSEDGGKVTKEMKDLLKREKTAIAHAKEIVDTNNKISQKIDSYIKEIESEGDLTLKGIFSNTILTEFLSGTLVSLEQVDEIYEKVRIEYLTHETHEQMNKDYNESKVKLDLEDCIESKFNEGISDSLADKLEPTKQEPVKTERTPLDAYLDTISGSANTLPANPIVLKKNPSLKNDTKNLEDWFSTLFNQKPSETTMTDDGTTFKYILKFPEDIGSTPKDDITTGMSFEDFDEFEPLTPEEKLAIHNDIYLTPFTKEEMDIAKKEALTEGWLEGDLKNQIHRLLVFISRLEDEIGI